MSLTADVREQTRILLQNIDETLAWLSDESLGELLGGIALGQHAYHMLHSLDQWFMNPFRYVEPAFHEAGLNSMDRPASKRLAQAELMAYFATIKSKLGQYLDQLSDEALAQNPEGSPFSRLTLVLAQYRHLMYHIGVLHCWAVQNTGKWPKWIGLSPPIPGQINTKP
jgi:hypothetical protein